MADLPAGTGLGSSSCYIVGVLNALHHHRRDYVSLQTLAEEACHIELDVLKEGIGKQDQYMAAFGGLTVLNIDKDGKVAVRQLNARAAATSPSSSPTRTSTTPARSAQRAKCWRIRTWRCNRPPAPTMRASPTACTASRTSVTASSRRSRPATTIAGASCSTITGRARRSCRTRSRLSSVDRIYDEVREKYGVLGGKIIGAGGGGFLMLYCPNHHGALERFMAANGMPRMHYTVEAEGTKVITQIGRGFRVGDPIELEQESPTAIPARRDPGWRHLRRRARCASRRGRRGAGGAGPHRRAV